MAQPLQPLTAEQEHFMKAGGLASLGILQDMPSPIKPALIVGAVGAGLGLIFAGKPLKWGLITGGLAFAAVTLAEASFAAGMAGGMLVTAEECKKSQRTGRPIFGYGY